MLTKFLRNVKLEVRKRKFTRRMIKFPELLEERIRTAQAFRERAEKAKEGFEEVDEKVDPIKKLDFFVQFKIEELGYRLFKDPGIEDPQGIYNRARYKAKKIAKEIAELHEKFVKVSSELNAVANRFEKAKSWLEYDQKEYTVTKDRIKQYKAEIEDLKRTLEIMEKRFKEGVITEEEFKKRSKKINAVLESKKESLYLLETSLKKIEKKIQNALDMHKQIELLKRRKDEIQDKIREELDRLMDLFENPFRIISGV